MGHDRHRTSLHCQENDSPPNISLIDSGLAALMLGDSGMAAMTWRGSGTAGTVQSHSSSSAFPTVNDEPLNNRA